MRYRSGFPWLPVKKDGSVFEKMFEVWIPYLGLTFAPLDECSRPSVMPQANGITSVPSSWGDAGG